jgi:hypothetical protein
VSYSYSSTHLALAGDPFELGLGFPCFETYLCDEQRSRSTDRNTEFFHRRATGMLCEVCIGVLQHRRNGLTPGAIHHVDMVFVDTDDSDDGEQSNDDKQQCIGGRSQAHDTDELPRLSSKVKCGHHRTSNSLALSAAAGCQICQPFWDRCSSSEKEHIRAVEETIASQTSSPYEFFSTAKITIKSQTIVEATLDIKYNHYKAWDSFTWPYWTIYVLKPGMCLRKPVQLLKLTQVSC